MWNFWINHHRWADCVYPNLLVKLFYHGRRHIICISQMAHSKWLTNLWMAFVWKTNIFKDVNFSDSIIIRVLNYFVVSPISKPFCTRKTIQKKTLLCVLLMLQISSVAFVQTLPLGRESAHFNNNEIIVMIVKVRHSLTLLQTFWGFLQFQSFSFSPIDILMI